MTLRSARPDDAAAIAAIYAPVVEHTTISFELEPPSEAAMRARIADTVQRLPWLVSQDAAGEVNGYAYASRLRERAAYQWSVEVSAYVRADSRGQGVGGRLYGALLPLLAGLGYCQAFAGIALPNAASVRLHEALGFEPLGVYRKVGFKHGAWHDVGWWQRTLQSPAVPQPPRPWQDAAWPPLQQPLLTPRLALRRLDTGDAAFMLELLNQPSFLRHIGDRGARDLDGARRYITERVLPAYERHGFGMYAVALRDGGVPIGICGLVRRDSLDDVDIGYALLERHWGRGHAAEAAAAVLRHARDDVGLKRLVAITAPDNAPSMALLRRLGLRYESTLDLPEGQSAFFVIDF